MVNVSPYLHSETLPNAIGWKSNDFLSNSAKIELVNYGIPISKSMRAWLQVTEPYLHMRLTKNLPSNANSVIDRFNLWEKNECTTGKMAMIEQWSFFL